MTGAERKPENDGDGPRNGLETFAQELRAQREAAGLPQDQ
jgi:hypothetical protein